uniref:Uncharacterized protein n=1 Tax=Opuntia streptacantha TaxID=393608 RepID=A0A7C8ZPR0_OPUST
MFLIANAANRTSRNQNPFLLTIPPLSYKKININTTISDVLLTKKCSPSESHNIFLVLPPLCPIHVRYSQGRRSSGIIIHMDVGSGMPMKWIPMQARAMCTCRVQLRERLNRSTDEAKAVPLISMTLTTYQQFSNRSKRCMVYSPPPLFQTLIVGYHIGQAAVIQRKEALPHIGYWKCMHKT